MPDFNVTNPPTSITDPSWKGGTTKRADEFPAHVHGEDGSYVVVQNAEEMAAKLKDGYKKQPWTAKDKEDAAAARDKKTQK